MATAESAASKAVSSPRNEAIVRFSQCKFSPEWCTVSSDSIIDWIKTFVFYIFNFLEIADKRESPDKPLPSSAGREHCVLDTMHTENQL